MLILESVYSDIDRALRLRMDDQFGPLAGGAASDVLLKVLEWRTGIDSTDVDPARAASDIDTFAFLMAGSADPWAPPEDSEAIAANLKGESTLYVVPGALHGEVQALGGLDFQRRFFSLLEQYLGS